MRSRDFQMILDQQIEQTRNVLAMKAEEYANNDDRLHNFKQAAALQQVTPVQAVGGMMVKHTVSVYDMINGGEDYTHAELDEKIGDHINYLILLKAAFLERAYENAQDEPKDGLTSTTIGCSRD